MDYALVLAVVGKHVEVAEIFSFRASSTVKDWVESVELMPVDKEEERFPSPIGRDI